MKIILKALVLLVAFMLVVGCSESEFEATKVLAEAGEADAQNNLGNRYYNGTGVARNDQEAARWYRLAAEQGNAHGQYNLGVMYENGRGFFRNSREAVRWYRLAAGQGHATAQDNLARAELKIKYIVGDSPIESYHSKCSLAPSVYAVDTWDLPLASFQMPGKVSFTEVQVMAKNYAAFCSKGAATRITTLGNETRVYFEGDRLVCNQKTDQEMLSAANLRRQGYKIIGTFEMVVGTRIVLSNCDFEVM